MNTKLRNVLISSAFPALVVLTATTVFLNTGEEANAKARQNGRNFARLSCALL